MMSLEELIQDLRGSDSDVHEAALILGLLIEKHFSLKDNDDIKEIVGEEWADKNLSEADFNNILDELINFMSDESILPHPMIIWALSKSYEQRALPHLKRLLERTLNDPDQENLSYQALLGVINIGMPSSNDEASITSIRKAAKQGHGNVSETAAQYLRTHKLDS